MKEGSQSLSVVQELDVIKRLDKGEQSMDIIAASVLMVGLFLSEKTHFRVLQQSCTSCAHLSKGTVNFTLEQAMTAQMENRSMTILSLTSAQTGVGAQPHAPAALPRERDPTNLCIGGWLDPRDGLDRCRKSFLPPGFDPRTTQLVTSYVTSACNAVFE